MEADPLIHSLTLAPGLYCTVSQGPSPYLSPEQFIYGPTTALQHASLAADVWAFGVLAMELAFGMPLADLGMDVGTGQLLPLQRLHAADPALVALVHAGPDAVGVVPPAVCGGAAASVAGVAQGAAAVATGCRRGGAAARLAQACLKWQQAGRARAAGAP